MMNAERSSGRASTNDPLTARPMGVRDAATMTASAMSVLLVCGPVPGHDRLLLGSLRRRPLAGQKFAPGHEKVFDKSRPVC